MRVTIAAEAFDPHTLLAAFAGRRSDYGAVASFIGNCRDTNRGERVHALELEHYPGFTEKEIARIGDTIAAKHDLLDALVVHRVGAVRPGETIVLVAALAAHRAGAFAAVEQMMDYLKTDAPFWKREHTTNGVRWIEPSDLDRARRAKHAGQS